MVATDGSDHETASGECVVLSVAKDHEMASGECVVLSVAKDHEMASGDDGAASRGVSREPRSEPRAAE